MLNEAYKTHFYYSEEVNPSEPLFLSIHISTRSLIYSISTDNFKSIVELAHFEWNSSQNDTKFIQDRVKYLMQYQLLDQKKVEKVNISLLNSEFTLIPDAYSELNNTKLLLKFNTGVEHSKNSYIHHLNGVDFCYTASGELINYLEKTFTNALIRHSGAITINLFFSQFSLQQCNLFLNIHNGLVELAVKENNNLLFYNVFNYETDEDVLYYLLFTMEQLNLNPLLVNLCIAGQFDTNENLVRNIKKYIKSVNFCVIDSSIQLKGKLNQLPHHHYFTILNQHLCEL